MSREFSTCSFRERKLGGDQVSNCTREQTRSIRDEETRINDGRFLVLPTFATSASDDGEGDLTRPGPFGSADLTKGQMCSSRRVANLSLSLSLSLFRRILRDVTSSPSFVATPVHAWKGMAY